MVLSALLDRSNDSEWQIVEHAIPTSSLSFDWSDCLKELQDRIDVCEEHISSYQCAISRLIPVDSSVRRVVNRSVEFLVIPSWIYTQHSICSERVFWFSNDQL